MQFLTVEPADVAQLRVVDVDRLRARHAAAGRLALWLAKGRVVLGGLRLEWPGAWPAVP